MAIQKITVAELTELWDKYPVLDVRSPMEYGHAHIPGAISLPIFSDEERKTIGTAYKQESRGKAIKLGLDFFGLKMRPMVEEVEKVLKSIQKKQAQSPQTGNNGTVIVHCWRGGMRSAAVAWLLGFYGFEVLLLEGGYKAFRNWVLQQFDKDYEFNIVGGYTGSGKTEVLQSLQEQGQPVIDLEGLASHKGSAFGALGLPPQPKQEMFENMLAISLFRNNDKVFWLEDESQRIGVLHIPHGFWGRMRQKPVFFLEIPFEERLKHICSGYGTIDKDKLVNAILRIQKRLGPLETKTAIGFLVEDDVMSCFRVLLTYYDKLYLKGLYARENPESLVSKISCSTVDALTNAKKLPACTPINT